MSQFQTYFFFQEAAPAIPEPEQTSTNGNDTTEVTTTTATTVTSEVTSIHSNSTSEASPVEPSKPDLIGDIVNNKSHSQSSDVDENNERNSLVESPVEKGVMDTQIKEENTYVHAFAFCPREK